MDNDKDKPEDHKFSRRSAVKAVTFGAAATVVGTQTSAQDLDLQQFGYINDLNSLKQFNLEVQNELSNDLGARESFLRDPQDFLRSRGMDLPSDAFPSSDELRAVMTDHGIFYPVDPDDPFLPDPNDPFAPDPRVAGGRDGVGPLAIAVCAVVI